MARSFLQRSEGRIAADCRISHHRKPHELNRVLLGNSRQVVFAERGPPRSHTKFTHSDNRTSAYPVDSTSPKGWGSGAMLPEYPPSFREFRMLFSDETSCWCPQRSPYQ